jgi:MFS superfamily sulfate permease-like transporter
LLGSLSYPGIPDPIFTGGFAGVASTTAFDSVAVTFNSTQAPAFALDNIIFANTPVPEPSTLLLAVLGCGVLLWRGRLNRA